MILKSPNDDTCISDVAVNGWVEITQEELLVIQELRRIVIDPKDAIRAQIKQLESEQLMPRAVREYMLLDLEYRFPAEVLAVNPGYQAVKAFDNQIRDLRGLL